MPTLRFVIGPPASGKSWFVRNRLAAEDPGAVLLDTYSYQKDLRKDGPMGYGDAFRCLYQANARILEDILVAVRQGKNVIVEHTLYKMKRRLVYLDAIRALPGEGGNVEFYVMRPGEERWKRYVKERELNWESCRHAAEDLELPNPAEGIDKIFLVTDEGIVPQDPPPTDQETLERARAELRREAERLEREDEERRERRTLLESMGTRPFWHYCEVCGRKELLTAEEAHEKGWDYPPKIGCFGMLGPRTCGDCRMKDTLFWKVHTSGGLPIVREGALTPEELVTWRRIKGEPESLLEQESGGNTEENEDDERRAVE